MSTQGWPLGNPHNWRPAISSTSLGQASVGYDEFRAVEVIDIPSSQTDLPSAISRILGYPWVDTSSQFGPAILHRVLPMAHPRFPWLYATKITSLEGRSPVAKLPADARKAAPITEGTMEYLFWRANVLFESPAWQIRSDADIAALGDNGGEFNRFVEIKSKYSLEVQTRRGGDFTYLRDLAAPAPPADEANSASPGQIPVGATLGQSLDFGVNLRIPKDAFVWSWKQVPETLLFRVPPTVAGGVRLQPGVLRASINYCRGKVNRSPFAGYPAQTLLLVDLDINPESCPIDPRLWGYADGVPARTYTVNYYISHINPPIPNNLPFSRYGAAGHNLVPTPFGQWWGATRMPAANQVDQGLASADSQLLYQGAEFLKLFNPDDMPR